MLKELLIQLQLMWFSVFNGFNLVNTTSITRTKNNNISD